MPYWIASMLTNVPVRPMTLGTVIDRKKVARFELSAAAGMDEHRVALAQRYVVHLQSGLQIRLGDQRAGVQARVLAGGVGFQLAGGLEHLDRVDDDAARGEGLEVLQAEPLEVVLGDV